MAASASPVWKRLNFSFNAPLPYKTTEFPNTECWPDGKGNWTRSKMQEEWKGQKANFESSNNIIQKDVKLIQGKLLGREQPGEWAKKLKVETYLRSVRAQIIDEEFKAEHLILTKDGHYGLCYSCGEFFPFSSLTAEHVQPKNSTKYSIIERQKDFLKKFSKITDTQKKDVLKKTRAKEFIIVGDKKRWTTDQPINKANLSARKEYGINEFCLRSYLNDISNLICMCRPCNTKTYYDSMEEKLNAYSLLTDKRAKKAFSFALETMDIMYTSSLNKEGLGHTIIRWVNGESGLFDVLRKQFVGERISPVKKEIPLTPKQEEVKAYLIETSPEKYKDQVEENVEDVIRKMKDMGISEKAVQKFLRDQWYPKAKRKLEY